MREIGVRELKAKLSSVLSRVERGERVRITRRGRPVADIVPVESLETVQGGPERSETMKRLIAEGRVTPASGSIPKNPPPPRKTGRSASAIILAEREEER
jgi:prevent-host-death family protein